MATGVAAAHRITIRIEHRSAYLLCSLRSYGAELAIDGKCGLNDYIA
ncbi:hypothetical protein ACPOL_0788 [Acidisarcina polymorpha]|uniref:Uncharacterized protein n=1 Tax=Acidisarcina polymorpha TaxID=2211140 RepID=A0A2Z5FTH5_9BACT|nr:hypothetical protein ACPOL_0788 [Acidisarcina polymorpha]